MEELFLQVTPGVSAWGHLVIWSDGEVGLGEYGSGRWGAHQNYYPKANTLFCSNSAPPPPRPCPWRCRARVEVHCRPGIVWVKAELLTPWVVGLIKIDDDYDPFVNFQEERVHHPRRAGSCGSCADLH